MVYYVEIDGDEHEFDRSWQVIDFMGFHGLKKLTVFYLREDGKSVQYNIDNFDNNMVLGGMLILKSSMTEEEAQETAKKIMLLLFASPNVFRHFA